MHLSSPQLAQAASDYRWLLDRGYAASAALKLVGDRRQMTRDERLILFRGVATSGASAARSAIIAAAAAGEELLVDGYNQALTIMHYLSGRPLFIGTDGLLRDAGGSHGRIADGELFEHSARLLVEELARLDISSLSLLLDAPVSLSASHAALFRSLFGERGLEANISLEPSADSPLKAAPRSSLVATSDSCIADALVRSGARLYDAARWTIDRAFGEPAILDLGLLIAESREAL